MSTTYAKGKYRAEILDQGFEESATKGTPCFYLLLVIIGRYDDEDKVQECPRYERTYRQYLANETGVNILRGDLKTLGVQVNDLTQLDPSTVGHVRLAGRQIDVICDLESYQGKQRERWGLPRLRKKLDLGAIRALSDQFGHLLQGNNGQAKPAPVVPKPNDSDVPF
jgi:hypothetical protein